jgi:hypothetical protein
MFLSYNISNVNPSTEISVADGVRCPSCETVIRAINAEIAASRTLIDAGEPTRF